jgi:hypothetical protein
MAPATPPAVCLETGRLLLGCGEEPLLFIPTDSQPKSLPVVAEPHSTWCSVRRERMGGLTIRQSSAGVAMTDTDSSLSRVLSNS